MWSSVSSPFSRVFCPAAFVPSARPRLSPLAPAISISGVGDFHRALAGLCLPATRSNYFPSPRGRSFRAVHFRPCRSESVTYRGR